jgi:hypothetical protein
LVELYLKSLVAPPANIVEVLLIFPEKTRVRFSEAEFE